jgi:hypothetical protein
MPRFRFDVCTDGITVEDREGLDLLSVEAARLEAARAASQMLRDRTLDIAEPADLSIIVRDGSPQPVCTIQVALKIQ